MNAKSRALLLSMVLGLLATALCIPSVVGAGPGAPRIAPPGSSAYGKTLNEWLGIYWRWNYSGADPAQGQVGKVKLMPLPVGEYVSGSGTPDDPALYRGSLDITLCPGTPFVLPLAAWIVERYEGYPETPDDFAIPNEELLAGVSPTFTIDGRPVVTDANEAAFYVGPTAFDPIVDYPAPTDYGSVAAVSFQGTGIVSPPLPVGRHVMHLYEPYIIDWGPYTFGQIYDNTWNVTVTPRCAR